MPGKKRKDLKEEPINIKKDLTIKDLFNMNKQIEEKLKNISDSSLKKEIVDKIKNNIKKSFFNFILREFKIITRNKMFSHFKEYYSKKKLEISSLPENIEKISKLENQIHEFKNKMTKYKMEENNEFIKLLDTPKESELNFDNIEEKDEFEKKQNYLNILNLEVNKKMKENILTKIERFKSISADVEEMIEFSKENKILGEMCEAEIGETIVKQEKNLNDTFLKLGDVINSIKNYGL